MELKEGRNQEEPMPEMISLIEMMRIG